MRDGASASAGRAAAIAAGARGAARRPCIEEPPAVFRRAIPVLVIITDAESLPIHLVIGPKARHLCELGLSDRRIAPNRVSDRTVAKSLRGVRTCERWTRPTTDSAPTTTDGSETGS